MILRIALLLVVPPSGSKHLDPACRRGESYAPVPGAWPATRASRRRVRRKKKEVRSWWSVLGAALCADDGHRSGDNAGCKSSFQTLVGLTWNRTTLGVRAGPWPQRNVPCFDQVGRQAHVRNVPVAAKPV